MKKLFQFIMLFALTAALTMGFGIGNQAIAQDVQYKNGSDTINNTGTSTVTFDAIPDGYSITLQAVVTKLSGTVAGTVVLQATVDGTNWYTVGDTLTNTNVTTNTKYWSYASSAIPGTRIRLLATGSGTMSATIKGWIVLRKG